MKKGLERKIVTALGVFALTGLLAAPAFAEEQAVPEFKLGNILITANRMAMSKADTAANVSVITAETIESRQYENVADAIKDIPGANVLEGPDIDEKKIILNGNERVLVLVDGKRVSQNMGMTSGRGSMDANQLPDVGMIERIEVVKGGGGALYGSDAVGGVINIITKKVDNKGGKLIFAMGSFGRREAKFNYGIKEKQHSLQVAYSQTKQDYQKYNSYNNGVTKWGDDSRFKNEKIGLKYGYEINKNSSLTFTYDYSQKTGKSYFDTTATPFDAADINKRTDSIALTYDWKLAGKDDGYFRIYHNSIKYSNKSMFDPSAPDMTERTLGMDVQQQFTTSKTNKLVVGASYYNSKVSNLTGGIDDEKVNNFAIFANDAWEFAPSWTLTAGARYDKHSKAGGKGTFSAGLNKKFNENSNFYVNWAQVFRAPTTDDLYYFADYSMWGMGKYMGNPDLKPESGDSWTIGFNTKLGKKTEASISVFQSSLKDAINWDYISFAPDAYVMNVDRQKNRGLELSLTHHLNDNVDLEASYTYLKRENDYVGAGYERDANVVPNMYRFGVRYHNKLWDANLMLRAGSGASSTAYIDSSYVTMDLAVAYKVSKNWKIFAKGYNLTNAKYANQGGLAMDYMYNPTGEYKYPAQSRRFMIGAEYRF